MTSAMVGVVVVVEPFWRWCTLVSAVTVKVIEVPSVDFTVIDVAETAVTWPRIAS